MLAAVSNVRHHVRHGRTLRETASPKNLADIGVTMTNWRGHVPESRLSTVLCSAVLLVLALAPFHWVLREPLSAVDAIPTIAAARVEAPAGFPSVLLRELRGGAQAGGSYWRPLTLATYTIDYAIWGWRPFGYHLTDLMLGGLAVLAVFWTVRLAFGRSLAFAAAVAAGFALHPAAVEVLPGVARRQEPLLVVGLCLGLIGAARMPSPRGVLLHLLGTTAALTSVERGLFAPALFGAYLLLIRFGQESALGTRAARAALWTLPSLFLALLFYATRGALFGPGGIVFEPHNLIRIPLDIALWTFYPQQFIDVRSPTSAIGWAGIAALSLALLASALVVLRNSRELPLLAFGAVWIASYCLLFTVAGQGHPWYVYTAVPAQMLIATALAAEAVRALRDGKAGAAAVASLLLATGVAVPSIATSPWLVSYPAWRTVDGLSVRLLEALDRASRSEPPRATLVLLNLPSSVRESDDDFGVTRSAAGLWPRSVSTWARVKGYPQQVIAIGAADHVGAIEVPQVSLKDGELSVLFPHGSSTYVNAGSDARVLRAIEPALGQGLVFPWPPDGVRAQGPIIPLVFDGASLVRAIP